MALTFFGVLVVTAGDGIIARLLRVPVYDVLNVLRVLVFVLPAVAGALAFLLGRALRRGDAARLGELTRADLRAARAADGRGSRGERARRAGTAGAGPTGERIDLWPEGDVWRWRYRDEPAGVAILSNRAVLTEQDAADSARLAYPGVGNLTVPGPPPRPPLGRVRTALRWWGNAALGASLLAAALRQRRERWRGGGGDGPERR